jgi:hypothetical protein
MPIESPQLDDLLYDRVVQELVRRIPVYAPEWTDHNDSDPGITLIQLFAHLTELVGYRLNRVPEKNYIELLKLMGVRLLPAHAASTKLALLLDNPAVLVGYPLAKGAKAAAAKGNPPPSFETDAALDITPCEPVLLVTTKNALIYDLLHGDDGTAVLPSKVPSADSDLLALSWDGKKPKLKDMPTDPAPLFKHAGHSYVWVGLDYNDALDAGFRGVRVTLTIQLDDDERPDLTKDQTCASVRPAGETAPLIDWLAYYDVAAGDIRSVPGRIDDGTGRLAQSGAITFTVPLGIGPIPDANWIDLVPPTTLTPFDACVAMADKMKTTAGSLSLGTMSTAVFSTVISAGTDTLHAKVAAAKPPLAHPLDPTLRDKAKGWIRLQLPAAFDPSKPSPKVRMVTFNAVPATNATSVQNEIVGRGDGRPGQSYALAHRNLLAGSLVLAIQENPDPSTPLVSWSAVDSLDFAGPFDSVFVPDEEAGTLQFGDGIRGRIPPLVPQTGQIIALAYRYGGGVAGEVGVGAVQKLSSGALGISAAVNFVAATGGRDAETLELAKVRARKDFATRSRAVTAADFQWIALETPGVRVARAEVVPLRRPLAAGLAATPPTPRCGPALPAGPLGLSPNVAAGAVTVIVVPDEAGPEPTPTPSFLREVCRQLDAHRRLSTEIHVVPPQFCRVCNVLIQVRGKPGYSRARLQALVETTLGSYLHVLKGGDEGSGFPFGAQLHIADLIARVFRTEGVDLVQSLQADFTRTKSNASPRQGQLVLCPANAEQRESVQLGPEENVSIDVTTINLSTVP